MKIGLVCPYNMFRPGGVQEVVRAHKAELQKRGHEVKIISPRPKKEGVNDDPDLILVSDSIEVNTPFDTLVDVSLRVDPDELDEMLLREQFDVLHFHEPWVPRMPMLLLERSPAVNVATFHAKLPESMFNKSIEVAISPYTKQVFKNLDYLTAVSEAAASYVSSLTNVTHIEIVPNAINLSVYNRAKVKEAKEYNDDTKTILYIGRLEKRKGTIWLLKAYRELVKKHGNIRLLIASDGHKRQMLEEFVEDNDLPNIEFLGFISDERKLELLKTADLFCSPALYGESFGIVLIEAMAMGTVTVCGNNIGYSSVMKGDGDISLVDPKDTVTFAHRLEHLLYDEKARANWQKWAKKYVQQFNYPVIVDRYEEIYNELLQERQKTA
jgi:phosphatidylinositol alpha-mannosyltransferase